MIRKVTQYYKLLITVENNYIQVEPETASYYPVKLYSMWTVYTFGHACSHSPWVDHGLHPMQRCTCPFTVVRVGNCEWYCGVDNGGKEFSLYCQLYKATPAVSCLATTQGSIYWGWGWGEVSPPNTQASPPNTQASPQDVFQLQFKIMVLRKLLPDSKHWWIDVLG